MSNITLTVFNGLTQNYTKPKSKYNSGHFIFANQECSLETAFEILSENWCLSRHLELSNPIKINPNYLDVYMPYMLSSIILDISHVYNQFNHKAILEYFKELNYACLIYAGPDYDGFDNFHSRVIIKTNISNKPRMISVLMKKFRDDLGSWGHIDDLNIFSPIMGAKKILYNKENGIVLGDSDIYILNPEDSIDNVFNITPEEKHINDILEAKKFFPRFFYEKCLDIFKEEGYEQISSGNSSLSFKQDTDDGYFWYYSYPFIMNHKNPKKKNSIFDKIRLTKEGKEWIKLQTKQKQTQELVKPFEISSYKSVVICNERYLNLKKKDKSSLINNFLASDKGVLKIKSAMGTAKSNVISEVISRASKKDLKVIIVSNRISVALDFEEKYGIKTYQDYSTINSKESVIVQYDSLHKYSPSDYDIAIFDEYASLLLHHRAGLTSNANINAVKFKILSDSKKVLIADAFLTGYEDNFFLGRSIYALYNNYRDNVSLYEYANKDRFILEIISRSESLNKDEHISCSFTSLQIMRIVESELVKKGIRVVVLSSETSELTKNIIYKRLKESAHSAFQVILFTPTLTVGVSNINNVIAHFHYDSGLAADVISSLQMTKRSRLAPEIHFYIEERQRYADTDISSLNAITKDKISTFYKNKDKTLLVEMDYATGELELTPLALYINKIEAFYNILENNHGNAFRLLLSYQFTSNIEHIKEKAKIGITEKSRLIKNQIRDQKIKIVDQYSDAVWDYQEILEIKQKIYSKTEEEQAKIIMFDLQENFKKPLPNNLLAYLAKIEIETDFQFVKGVKNIKTILQSDFDTYAKYQLSNALTDDIKSLQDKSQIQFLQYVLKLPYNFTLESSYDKKDINAMNEKLNTGRKFERFLKSLGYIWKDKQLQADIRVYKFLDYL